MEVDQEAEIINEVQDDTNPYDYQYKLVGVVIHMGNADAGHYLSYINIDRNQDSSVNTDEWMKTEN